MPKYAEEILAAAMELQQHPKAEQVFLEMKREHPSIALGTVYLPPCREQEKTILWRRSIMNTNVSLLRILAYRQLSKCKNESYYFAFIIPIFFSLSTTTKGLCSKSCLEADFLKLCDAVTVKPLVTR